MHRTRILVVALAVLGMTLACGIGSAPSASGNDLATVVASTMQALTPAHPPATAVIPTESVQGIPVKYKNVSFTIPAGLATDAVPQTVPAATADNVGPWDAAPEHIEFALDSYNTPANGFTVEKIDIYPAQPYADTYVAANIALQHLKALMGDPASSMTTQNVPVVPFFNAAPMIVSKPQRLSFQNGGGVRLVTQYGQGFGPIANSGTFYNFQGLTSDGKYYIVAVLPVQAPILQNGQDPNAPAPAGGVPFPGMNQTDTNSFEEYFQAVADKLNNVPEDQFSPSLAQLDAMMQSISVSP